MPAYRDTKRNTWSAVLSYKDIDGTFKKKWKRGFETKKEALNWIAKHSNESKTTFTFREILELYLDDSEATETTRTMKTGWIEHYFPLVDERIEKISRADMLAWRNSLKDTGLANRTLNRGIQYVKSVFNFASTIYGVPNPSVVVKTFKLSKQDKEEMKVWTPQEFEQFLACVELPVYKTFFLFLFMTGCRRGEAMALQYTDIKNGKVHIHRSIKHYKNGFMPLKTDSSERTISLPNRLKIALEPLLERCNDKAPFVFGFETSLAISSIQREFNKAIKKSGVKPIRIHDLRHSHATWLINNGANIVAVSKRLGHSSINQTLSSYTHLLQDTDEKLIELMDSKL